MGCAKKVVTIRSKFRELSYDSHEDNWGEFKQLAKLTAMRRAPDGVYYLGNFWRGPLLYALVSYYKPRNILEFGTGRGYGASSMAKAGLDQDFECTVWTIDRVSPSIRQPWPIDEGNGPTVKFLSLQEVWERYVPVEIRERIRCLTGNSYYVMREWKRWRLPSIDFFFIDGGHNYWTVKHDFIAALRIANPKAVFVFDDYGARKGYGVKRLIDKEILPKCPSNSIEIIDTLAEQARPASEGQVEHKMVLLDTQRIPDIGTHFYSNTEKKIYMSIYPWLAMSQNAIASIKKLGKIGLKKLGILRSTQ